jgi:hypothetical protein
LNILEDIQGNSNQVPEKEKTTESTNSWK